MVTCCVNWDPPPPPLSLLLRLSWKITRRHKRIIISWFWDGHLNLKIHFKRFFFFLIHSERKGPVLVTFSALNTMTLRVLGFSGTSPHCISCFILKWWLCSVGCCLCYPIRQFLLRAEKPNFTFVLQLNFTSAGESVSYSSDFHGGHFKKFPEGNLARAPESFCPLALSNPKDMLPYSYQQMYFCLKKKKNIIRIVSG